MYDDLTEDNLGPTQQWCIPIGIDGLRARVALSTEYERDLAEAAVTPEIIAQRKLMRDYITGKYGPGPMGRAIEYGSTVTKDVAHSLTWVIAAFALRGALQENKMGVRLGLLLKPAIDAGILKNASGTIDWEIMDAPAT